MEENIYNQEDTAEVSRLRILRRRVDNELHIANAGCHSLIGIIQKIDGNYYIKGYLDPFDKEQDAIDVLMMGL